MLNVKLNGMDRSNEIVNVIMDEMSGNETESVQINEIYSQIVIDQLRNIEEFNNVFEDGFDELLVQALIEFEEQEEKKKEDFLSKQEFKNENKKENRKRKHEDNEKNKKNKRN
ncbi:hypothetical protein RF55_19475 [Lasius niger]|uniref:Uncharacterized protein n=1 Tax=Lasius niger TaxID=67767 RepID=A0A0J7K0G8_LASNI|nr:hypothetical protein RF55_19475 [Lasius niger]